MSFQIHALPQEEFANYWRMSDDALAAQKAQRCIVQPNVGTPCRVSMKEAKAGETVILLNYIHQAADTPYQSGHAIYIRENAQTAQLTKGQVPEVMRNRLLSLRGFDADDMMVFIDVVEGREVEAAIARAFSDPAVAYIHAHNAKAGCFAAKITRD